MKEVTVSVDLPEFLSLLDTGNAMSVLPSSSWSQQLMAPGPDQISIEPTIPGIKALVFDACDHSVA
jgi:hypothetical protein